MNWKDMCASVIFSHRVKDIPLKALHLLPKMYEQFQWWTQKQLGRELNEDEQMEFDGVHIEKGYKGQSTPIVVELWDNNFNMQQALKQIKGIA
jgi:hypothetical protein